ncbi:40S ribosomal protein mrp10 [Friedmanniomyces endolithicus]|uniref:40S ribosomal protein mrp10 n=1 Tax=Friedmanniomyces endolithicus TaxID=329885 RepID=A0AAN6KY10_9PEZI|nr:40S ribosomal protein mrp10 [Friedmanniomyces endolithicus]KAK0770661.1 40S ribosomal protein mrp10 [Friedmanniomyces endolithicus]KAK0780267.1 40S ribosomal protein mrp10 [Friedmanniomyces endolithicus]KAK0802200.1 40S ribosomal protein mrp10 [Friedmanniomyces endolithicus]KAK0833277.1 40S ribosomal protein mrp10 [Friedmanniomyces endolithicus]
MVVGKNNSQNLARAVSSPKLPPLPKLRVRRPNTTDANPCIGVMSSVLGTATPMGAREEYQIGRGVQQMPRAGLLLGITRLQCAGLRDAGAIATGVYGCAGMYSSWTSTFWLGSLTHGLWQKPTEAKKSNINYHLSRFYPQIIGPHKRK